MSPKMLSSPGELKFHVLRHQMEGSGSVGETPGSFPRTRSEMRRVFLVIAWNGSQRSQPLKDVLLVPSYHLPRPNGVARLVEDERDLVTLAVAPGV